MEFIQGIQDLLNIRKSMNIIYYLNCAKEKKNHMIIYMDTEKTYDKIKTHAQ